MEFTISVSFDRFTELKGLVEQRKRWRHFNERCDYFEPAGSLSARAQNSTLSLCLHGYDFKMIATNKRFGPRKVLTYYNGRDTQEDIFAELKSPCHFSWSPHLR